MNMCSTLHSQGNKGMNARQMEENKDIMMSMEKDILRKELEIAAKLGAEMG